MSTTAKAAQLQAQAAPIFATPALIRIPMQDQLSINSQSLPINNHEGASKTRPFVHFVAGGVGGMAGAIFTSPLDVVKTRLQSTYYQKPTSVIVSRNRPWQGTSILGHFGAPFRLLGQITRLEGFGALYKGLGPNLIGVIPARSINFCAYGNGKRILADNFNNGKETPTVHLFSAIMAGIITSTATNPIWVVKTRMQLQPSGRDHSANHFTRKYKNSFHCLIQIVRDEGIKGLYKGMSASYLGVAESTIQWVVYEQLKSMIAESKVQKEGLPLSSLQSSDIGGKSPKDWVGHLGSAAVAKFIAACISYPHEVLRTRLRQPAENGVLKYTGLVQCFKTIVREEGVPSLYGGITAHLIRVIPNAAIMFFCYEAILHQYGEKKCDL
ncbi:hypothetical protein BC936DRAFT_143728 [Jimgerdemannia flammicorona]|uniref:Uncharacterized protein n=3 Tax=Jimgerdemannia flammicorona TaxID=994334 RepID=A0A433QMS0_9FUNG|nr:hypothetical protein BC936DRAFT_143728 [Jimgerdemannia flammicorona]RUS31070.1 hypothetical protein BC938DRAFT_478518 [Jimgerdemannia flammicorona]